MKILRGIEIPIAICISYTILSVYNAAANLIAGREMGPYSNSLLMLLFTSIAILVLSLHHLFDEWPPAVMIAVQYIIAIGLVFLTVYLFSFFEEIGENGYRDILLNFTIPYIIGGMVYYISLFLSVKRQNNLLTQINAAHEKNKIRHKN